MVFIYIVQHHAVVSGSRVAFPVRERECTGLPFSGLGKLFLFSLLYHPFANECELSPFLPATPILPLAAGSLWLRGSVASLSTNMILDANLLLSANRRASRWQRYLLHVLSSDV